MAQLLSHVFKRWNAPWKPPESSVNEYEMTSGPEVVVEQTDKGSDAK